MITTRNLINWFPLLSYMGMGLRLEAFLAAPAPLQPLAFQYTFSVIIFYLVDLLHLPLVVKLEPGFVVDFPTPRLSSAVVAGTLAVLTAAEAAADALAVLAAAGTVEGTVEAVVLAAAKPGGPEDD